ncbi:MAG: hypothetical protein ACREYE_11455, partial [Gammaproteobacteria bacterium]
GHHQEDRAGAGQDGADQARIHPASREKEGGLTVKLFKGHYTSELGQGSPHAASGWRIATSTKNCPGASTWKRTLT